MAAARFAAAVALLAGLGGCAAAPPRTMSFREAGLLDRGPVRGPDEPQPSASRSSASPASVVQASARPPSVARTSVAGSPRVEPELPVIPPVRDVAPEAVPTEPPEGPPIDPVLLRFAAEARSRRLRTAAGHGFPPEAETSWRRLVGQLDDYLTRSLPQTPLLELVRCSVTVEAEWDFDLRRHGPAPAGLARLVAARAERLTLRIATSRAIGQTMFAFRPPGRLRWPIENAGLSSGFGPRDHPLTGTRQLHAGIDLAADLGRVVSAATQGYVVSAGWAGGYGLLVEVRHPGDLTTRYGHLSALLCAPGDALEAGAPVGLIGQTGLATGPHLHFEVWEGGRPRDPLAFIGGGTGLAATATAGVPSGGPR
jgi:hypothetical protein